MTAMASALAGADMLVGLGGLDRDGVFSAEKLVMDCEVWRWIERLRRGIELDEARFAVDAVKRQGPGGTFLSDPHTLRFMRTELMIPQVTSFHSPGEPDRSQDELRSYSRKRVGEILASHKPPLLEGEAASRVKEVAKRWGVVHKDGSHIFASR
jgi:trimethylamine--corrinoid protein Co-methyltransferase